MAMSLSLSQPRSLTLVGRHLTQTTLAEVPEEGIETGLVFGEATDEFAGRLADMLTTEALQQAVISSAISSEKHPAKPTVDFLKLHVLNALEVTSSDRIAFEREATNPGENIRKSLELLMELIRREVDPWVVTGLTIIAPPLRLCRLVNTIKQIGNRLPFEVQGGIALGVWIPNTDNEAAVRELLGQLVLLMEFTREGLCVPEETFELGGELYEETVDCLKLARDMGIRVQAVHDMLHAFGEL